MVDGTQIPHSQMHQQMKCINALLDCYADAFDPPIEIFPTIVFTDPYDSTFTTMPHLDIATRPPPPLSGMMKPSGELHISIYDTLPRLVYKN